MAVRCGNVDAGVRQSNIEVIMSENNTKPTNFKLNDLKRERIATQCVCCGSKTLKSSSAILMPFVAHRVFGWKPVQINDSWGLKTIRNGTAYSICNSLFCSDCSFLFLDIRFSDAELNALYDGYRNQQYTELRETYEPGYKLRNDSLNAGVSYITEIEMFLTPHLSFPVSIRDRGGGRWKEYAIQRQS